MYERIMKFEYEGNVSDTDFAKLSADLHKKGVSMVSGYKYGIEVNEKDYGYNTVVDSHTRHIVAINDTTVLDASYRSDANKTYDGLNTYFADDDNFTITQSAETTDKSRKEWIKPENKYCNIRIVGIEGTLADRLYNCLVYEVDGDFMEEVVMEVYLERKNYGNIILTFKTKWETESIKRKEVIESVMVDRPVKDMGLIQSTVESRLKLKKYDVSTQHPEINCHFDAKTESRSECTPDIINKVREARKNH
tara:strand:+ start:27046 stop:27795 length:750 start_codon:yes stop_codon:yes gene_type:complete